MTERAFEECVEVVIAAPGGSADGNTVNKGGIFGYIEVQHPGAGDPDYLLQIINKRGTPVWQAPQTLTGDCVVHVGERIPMDEHKVRIKDSTLAGTFIIYTSSRK